MRQLSFSLFLSCLSLCLGMQQARRALGAENSEQLRVATSLVHAEGAGADKAAAFVAYAWKTLWADSQSGLKSV